MNVRSAVEMAVPLWGGSITVGDSNTIERVQKIALKLILGPHYESYDQALEKLSLDSLKTRRENLCLKFAKKCTKNVRFEHWFPKKKSMNTRYKEVYLKPRAKTKRYLKSSIPYLVDLLNKDLGVPSASEFL